MDENGSNFGSFLAGVLAGALIGGITALILAPQSGEATRRQLTDLGTGARDASQERIEQMREAADAYSREYREMASSAVSDARSRAQELGEQVQEQTRIVLDAGKDSPEQTANHSNANDTQTAK